MDNNDPHYDICLAIKITQNYRETAVKGTPIEYTNLYTGNYKLILKFFLI
jgi:hypothetical protein